MLFGSLVEQTNLISLNCAGEDWTVDYMVLRKFRTGSIRVTLLVVSKAGGRQNGAMDRLLGSKLLNQGCLGHRHSGCDLQAG